MELREYVTLLVIFSLVAVGSANFYGQVTSHYNITVSQNISALNAVGRISNMSSDLETQLRRSQISIPIVDVPFAIVQGVYTIMKLLLVGVPDLWFSFINSLAISLGIPSWATAGIMVLLILGVIFEIIAVIMRYKT